ncbi:hypothetical protein SUGI_0464790 [Cryptomeria japonica]|nr:hypothetical protein SUGI_0464790 [Cryptomeria japonica]
MELPIVRFSKLVGADAFPAIAMLFIFFCFVYTLRRLAPTRLPPGPFAWPIIGNLHQLGMLPHHSLKDLAHKYGPIMYLRLGSFPTLVVSSSDMAKEVLTTHDLAFAGRPSLAAYFAYNQKPASLAPYGDHFRRVKKIWMTQLLSAKRLESFRVVREEAVCAAMRSVWEKSKEGTVSVNVSHVLLSLTKNLIWQILAGSIYSVGSSEQGFLYNKEIADMMEQVIETVNAVNIGDSVPLLGWLDVQGLKKKMREANDSFDRLIQNVIDEHASAKSSQKSTVEDVIDALLDMAETDDSLDIKSIIFVLLFSAIETTAASLEWAMVEMLRNTHVAKKLEQEIDSVVGKDRMGLQDASFWDRKKGMPRDSNGSGDYRTCVVTAHALLSLET